jgi:hypothetical protein
MAAITDIDAPMSFNHPIVDFNKQVHGFTSIIFVHRNLAISKSLSSLKSLTSAAMVKHSAQSLHPHGPCPNITRPYLED